MVGRPAEAGCDAVYTLELPDGNATPDDRLIAVADREGRVVITKHADFVDSHLLTGRPAKLLLISPGNIGNREREASFLPLIPDLIRGFQRHASPDLNRSGLIVRG